MPTTFMSLTNTLLRRLNEVEISQSDFAGVRGVQALAKDAINAAIEDINTQEFEWPFNATTGSQVLTIDIEEYNFPSNLRTVNWDSFNLTGDAGLGVNSMPLHFVSRDQRQKLLRGADDDSSPDGRGTPRYVFPKAGFGFGVTPSPDAAYTITYEYFLTPTTLSAYNDESTIYPQYDEAIIQGGLYHMYMFRDNDTQAQLSENKFNKLVGRMRTQTINKDDRVYTGMITHHQGNGAPIADYGYYGIEL